MEQRIGPSSQPLDGAGIDPAFIPGLTSPVVSAEREDSAGRKESAEQEDSAGGKEAAERGSAARNDSVASEDTGESEGSVEPSAKPEDAVEPGHFAEPRDAVPGGGKAAAGEPEAEATTEDAAGEAPGGPVFEAADRRARIVADHTGVRLRLDDQECDFRWDEVGAVETETPRFGKRFTVTVHTPDRRWYPIEIEATARARFKEWETRLDEVLDAYFEDGEHQPATLAKDED
ncbi:hypothetical protein [Streptomyces sp. NPDC047079]|uniref:hypothetical protein n=1 Tax=Streptomyces sp. NPDC047079 TaxID=3154607 RepID=UPI0033DA6CB3